MSKADIAFEEEDNAFVLDQFSEHAALRTYRTCCEPKAAEYLAQLEPPKPEKKESFGRPVKEKAGLDLSALV